ncbi:hypothetical protein [Martelella soudanensis]|uniref:hypothetical protein n=1 Tax=unclassified Martelella TaxID=2629616 RepID=UPI001FEDEEDC|nr:MULTISPECIES: hypothetical protein [unclassified Martelella]
MSAFSVLLIIVAAGWLGMLVGVSFLATPAKFLAPSLTLPVALDVGRHTFAVYNKVEWEFSVALLLLAFLGRRGWISAAFTMVAVLIVACETLWLLPLLDARVGVIIAGGEPAPSNLHTLHIALEAAKMVAIAIVLVEISWRVLRRPNERNRRCP